MITHGVATVERSEAFINNLVQDRAKTIVHGVAVSDLIGRLVVPSSADGSRQTQLIVIAGGAASGKSTLAENLSRQLRERATSSAIMSSDDFVRWNRKERHRREQAGMLPEEKYDFDAMRHAIGAVCANQIPGNVIEVPQYDSHSGLALDAPHRRPIPDVDVLLAEGDVWGERGMLPRDLYPGHALRPLTIYTHVADQTRLARRIERDMLKRNGHDATPDDIVRSFEHRQDAQHFPYTLQYARGADVILTPPAQEGAQTAGLYDMYVM